MVAKGLNGIESSRALMDVKKEWQEDW